MLNGLLQCSGVLAALALGASAAKSRGDPLAVPASRPGAEPVKLTAPIIRAGDLVAVVGDSITEQRLYSAYIEQYLLLCQPVRVRVINFGVGGEQVSGLIGRIDDVLLFKPNVVTTCYGMNDGGYSRYREENQRLYRENTETMVKAFAATGARVVVGSPGVVDTGTFVTRPNASAEDYNVTLDAFRVQAKFVAGELGQAFADVHTPMMETMAALKAKYGPAFQVAGADGIHPGGDGHLVMAYAFLKAMGFDGKIGEFDVDLNAHTATATDGHKVLKFEGNAVTIESTRYPFCFAGKPGDFTNGPGEPSANAVTTEYLPFNQELNRLILKVAGPAARYKVTWGATAKTFSADQLKSGVNLAAQFQDNPFSKPFNAMGGRIFLKQTNDVVLTKNLLRILFYTRPQFPQQQAAYDSLIKAIPDRIAETGQAVADAVKPVTHTITIEPQN